MQGAALACATPAHAEQIEEAYIWPAQALYGLERTACGRSDSGGSLDTAMVAALFCDQFTPERRAAIGKTFAAATTQHFHRVEVNFGEHLPPTATQQARLRGTLVASLHLSRANYTTVSKPLGVDVYLPLTLTFNLTNVATGEVVFTRTLSSVSEGKLGAQSYEGSLKQQFPAHLAAAIEQLVAEAGLTFHPYAQVATVVGEVTLGTGRKAWVVDRGRAAGFRKGDAIGPDGKVVFSGPDYSIVQAELESFHTGQALSRIAVAPVQALSRPSILTVMDSVPPGYAPPYLAQVFDDAVGTTASLAPIAVNPAFSALRPLALESAGATLASDSRSLPDYIVSVRVALLDPFAFPSNVPGVTIERFEAHAFVTMVDATGRAVGAWHGSNIITDQISAGVRFAPGQRNDAVVRNALLDAAKQMAAFRPQSRLLPITGKAGTFTIIDPTGSVPLQTTFPVLRDAGHFRGLSGNVRIPIGSVTTRESGPGTTIATGADVTALSLLGGEVVAMETSGTPAVSRGAVSQCIDSEGKPRVDDRGAVPDPLLTLGAENLFAQRSTTPVHLALLSDKLKGFAPSFSNWEGFGAANDRATDACFLPVVAVQGDQSGHYSLTVGYAIYRNDNKVGANGLRVVLTPTPIPADAGQTASAAMLQADLAAKSLPLALSAVSGLNSGL